VRCYSHLHRARALGAFVCSFEGQKHRRGVKIIGPVPIASK
jgi:hypothetical protein